MNASLFLIVGNSASGKDTAIKYVLNNLNNIKKAKRYITRPKSITEEYVSLEKNDFLKQDYCLWWESYDKFYGVKKEDVIFHLLKGTNIILNISRDVIDQAKNLWEKNYIVEFSVAVEIIKQRLNNRKRETNEEIKKRILRAKQGINVNPEIIIDTSSEDLTIAGKKFLEFIKTKIN
jgi:phosphonate metabolism protein PhnN/1,5-bisphosphokinase (PRPP-forming)